jgi:hypothetical protein
MPLESFLARLDRHEHMFDLDGELGLKLLRVAALGAVGAFIGEVDPAGPPWAPLSHPYAERKEVEFPGEPMGIATGEMAEGLLGERWQSVNEAHYTFGQTEAERQKAVWFQTPKRACQPPRKFFGFTRDSIEGTIEVLTTHLKENL